MSQHPPTAPYPIGTPGTPWSAAEKSAWLARQAVRRSYEADARGCLIGTPLAQPGVINYAKRALGLCGGMTGARFVTTTEVHPDSATATPAQCNAAQVATVAAAIAWLLAHRP